MQQFSHRQNPCYYRLHCMLGRVLLHLLTKVRHGNAWLVYLITSLKELYVIIITIAGIIFFIKRYSLNGQIYAYVWRVFFIETNFSPYHQLRIEWRCLFQTHQWMTPYQRSEKHSNMAALKIRRLCLLLMPIILAFRLLTEEGLGFEASLDNIVSSVPT